VADTTQRFFSVTTLIKDGLGTSGGLVEWGKGEMVALCFDRYEMLGAFVRDGDRGGAVKWAKNKYWDHLSSAAARGTDLHKVAEKWALGLPVEDIAPAIQPYAEQYLAFLEDFRPTFLMSEAPVYNTTYGYAGTCDGVVEMGGQTLLFDIKTTAHGPNAVSDSGRPKNRPPFPEVALQLVAYRRAELVGVLAEQRYSGTGQRYYVFDPEAKHEPMPQTDGAVCVVVSPEDYLVVPIKTGEAVWRSWRNVIETARWQVWTSKAVIGNPIVPPMEVAA
jgi:hypothetical protein